ncbi:hypothetical protein KP79_PYT19109 [Mizuhopecten yessoensis]|uniref:Uncharacterized protein n=1 Tax=Mizuhopecten yessoensis TaxID=6573 RepID=A0A210PT79_MIZYE|nr:hypothetical protein KP79_PYT19109 [Mizuhopecten yessoensis]
MAFSMKYVLLFLLFGLLLTSGEETRTDVTVWSRLWNTVSGALWMTEEVCEEGGGVFVRGTCYQLIDLDDIQSDIS